MRSDNDVALPSWRRTSPADPVERSPHRPQLAADLSRRARRPSRTVVARPDRFQCRDALLGETGLVGDEFDRCRFHRVEFVGDHDQLLLEPRRFGLEVGDEVGVEQLDAVTLQRTTPLGEHGGQPACTLAELFDPHEPIAAVALAARRQLGFDRHDPGVETGRGST